MAENLIYMRISTIIAAAALALLAAPVSAAPGTSVDETPLFVGGGTPLTNGVFFPGTAVYDGNEFVGQPLPVPKGTNVQFINLDYAPATNAHKIVSFKRKKKTGLPLFSSPIVNGPGTVIMKTAKVRPGVYPYYCAIHSGMFGLIEITKG